VDKTYKNFEWIIYSNIIRNTCRTYGPSERDTVAERLKEEFKCCMSEECRFTRNMKHM